MAEIRRSGAGGPARGGPGRGPGTGSRRPAPPKKPTPKLVWVGLSIAPLVIILLVVSLFRGGSEPQAAPAAVKVDPNANIKRLQNEVSKLEARNRDLQKLIRAEDAQAKSKTEALLRDLDRWIEEWDAIFEPQRRDDGMFPPELRSYQLVRSRVNTLTSDLRKSMGF